MQLEGKRIVVTGGARGIGAAVVQAYVAEGAVVSVLDLREDEARGSIALANAGGAGNAAFFRYDVSDADSVSRAFEGANRRAGGLDVLVHAAGIAPSSAAQDIALEDWEQVFAVNARGTFLTNRAAFAAMKGVGGRIVNFASGAGVRGYAGKAHYAASKGAVLAWTRTVAREWGPLGITVNAIAPAIRTPMYEATRARMSPSQLAHHDEAMRQTVPLGGRLGDPVRDLAPVLVFLAGDGARFVTGQTLPVDGGLMMLS